MRLVVVGALGLAGLLVANECSAQTSDREAAIGVVRTMFAALAKGDTAGMRATFYPEARVVQTGTREGKRFYQVNPIDDFLKSIGAAAGRKLEEQLIAPTAQVDDNLAVVWAKYRFLVDGKTSHCGVDSYQLVRGDAGWKLLHIVDTQRACGK